MNLQGEPPSRKTGKGQETSAKGSNQDSKGTALEKSEISRNTETGKTRQNSMRSPTEKRALEMTNGTFVMACNTW